LILCSSPEESKRVLSRNFQVCIPSFRLSSFSISLLHLVECRSGGISFLKIFGPPARHAPPPIGRTSGYFVVESVLLSFPSHENRLLCVKLMVVVSSSPLSSDLCPLLIFVVDDLVTSVNCRRLLFLASLGLGQILTSHFWKKTLNWACPILGTSRFRKGSLRLLGCTHIILVCLNIVQRSSSAFIVLGYICLSLCQPFAFSRFISQQFTEYFSGFPLLTPDTSPVGPFHSRFSTTFFDLDLTHRQRSLFTEYFSDVSMSASKANPRCFQPRTTFDGLNFVLMSLVTVTIFLPVEVFVLFTISLMGMLVLVSFETSHGLLSNLLQLVSLCLSYVWSTFQFSNLLFGFVIRVCPMKTNLHVSF